VAALALRALLARRRAGYAVGAVAGILLALAGTTAALWATFGWRIGLPAAGVGLAALGRQAYLADAPRTED